MRICKILFIAVFCISGAAVSAQTSSTALSYDQKIHDFGKIPEKGGKVYHTFVFTNTSAKPIVIDGFISGCSCAGVEFSSELVKPGETTRVTAFYDPNYRPGFFSKQITLLYNNQQNYTRIWVKGTVEQGVHPVSDDHPYSFGQGLHTSLKVLAFLRVKPGGQASVQLFYANDTDKPMTLVFESAGGNGDVKYTNPGQLEPGHRGKMYFYYEPSEATDTDTSFDLYPVVNGKRTSEPLKVKLLSTEGGTKR